ncbi:MAG: cation:proton antiporter [Xenococcaceae cyanobacterium MO_188.B32]|nr:cation:proton antiporter [Xenococcaceae cyanobacterium MO_188.B32]
MESFINAFNSSPIIPFTLLLLVILTLPPLFERLKLPGLVGLLFAGIIFGPNGLNLLNAETETMTLLSDIGKIYLMFVAGLEIDLEEFRKTKERSLGFGIATFIVPLATGTAIAYSFGMGLNASVLVGSLLASHTLLGYPIVNRLGVVGNEAVTVTIGATIFTDIAALLILAICVSIHAGDFSPTSLFIQLVTLGLYAGLVLFGLDKAGKEYFQRTGDEESNQFLFILLAVFLAAVGAQIINVDKIVGAFLAGLAVNDVVGRSPVEEKVEFVGSTLFIPFFFVDMGLLLDIPGFVTTLTSELWLTLAIVGGLFASKFIAGLIAKLLYGYSWNEALTMWSLSLPQVAATLAAALVGVNSGLISDVVFNVVIVLMLVTSIAGPILTAKFASNLSVPVPSLTADKLEGKNLDLDAPPDSGFLYGDLAAELETNVEPKTSVSSSFRVVVPIANPQTERYLIEMGALIAHHESGVVVPLSVTQAHVYMGNPALKERVKQSRKLLKKALEVAREFQVKSNPVVRIDDDVAQGICRAAREKNASLILMGINLPNRFRDRLFGNVIDSVFWSAHCPVAVLRLVAEPINIQQILVPIKSITPQAIRMIRFAQLFAEENQAAITLFHVANRQTSRAEVKLFETNLKNLVDQLKPQIDIAIKSLRYDDAATAIVARASSYDMVVLGAMHYRTAGGLAVGDTSDRLVRRLKCSLVLFSEPHSV